MPLGGIQAALGRVVRARNAEAALDDLDLSLRERETVARVVASPGFRLTAAIQRSWCEGRAAKSARFTLALLAPSERERLIAAWVDRAGGTNSFFFAEADAFLGFLSEHLSDPSHARSACLFERAVLRADHASGEFVAPDLQQIDPGRRIVASADAAMVTFFADPGLLLAAARGEAAPPPLLSAAQHVLIAPNLPGFARPAKPGESSLWDALAVPVTIAELERSAHGRESIMHFLTIGVAKLQ